MSRPAELNIPVLNVKVANASVPLVNVVVLVRDRVNVSPKVVVPDVLLIVSAPNVVLVFDVIVPVPTIVAVNPVNVPPLLNIRSPTIDNAVVGIVNAVVPKLSLLNQLPVVIVAMEAPVVNVKLGALVEEPAVVPNVRVLVLLISATVKPPVVAVYVKLVAVAISNTVVAAVVCVNAILPVPNDIALVTAPDELNIPVVNVKLANANVPLVSVVVPVATNARAVAKVVVPAVLLIVSAAIVLPVALVIVPVPTIVAVRPVYTAPTPPLNVKLFKFNAVVPGLNVVVPKLSKLNQLPVVNATL